MRIIALFLALSAAAPCSAFSGRDHRRLTRAAIGNLHPAHRKLLAPHTDYLEKETPAPDFIKRKGERSNHVWHPRGDWGNNVKQVVKLSEQLVRELRPVMQQEGKLKRSTLRKLAHLAHYVQDLCQPLHTSQRDKDEDRYHELLEKLWQDEKLEQVLVFRGKVKPIADIQAWHKANGKWSNQFYDSISADWHDDGKFNRKRTFEIYRLTFSRAHRATVEIWTTLLHRAAQPEKKEKK